MTPVFPAARPRTFDALPPITANTWPAHHRNTGGAYQPRLSANGRAQHPLPELSHRRSPVPELSSLETHAPQFSAVRNSAAVVDKDHVADVHAVVRTPSPAGVVNTEQPDTDTKRTSPKIPREPSTSEPKAKRQKTTDGVINIDGIEAACTIDDGATVPTSSKPGIEETGYVAAAIAATKRMMDVRRVMADEKRVELKRLEEELEKLRTSFVFLKKAQAAVIDI